METWYAMLRAELYSWNETTKARNFRMDILIHKCVDKHSSTLMPSNARCPYPHAVPASMYAIVPTTPQSPDLEFNTDM